MDGHTWAAGNEPTDVVHEIVALDVWDVAQEVILLPCPVWVSWFDEDVEP